MIHKTRTFSLNGIHMKYYVYGSGPPLIFFHGITVRAFTYQPLVNLLTKKYTVIIPDLPFHGASSVPRCVWSYEDFALYLFKFIKSMQLTEVSFAGHSFGGGLALCVAEKLKTVKKVLIIDGDMLETPYSDASLHVAVVRELCQMFFSSNIKRTVCIVRDIFNTLVKNHIFSYRLYKIVFPYSSRNGYSIQHIKSRTLLIWGKRDHIIPALFVKKLSGRNDFFTYHEVEGHHGWCLYKPELLKQYI